MIYRIPLVAILFSLLTLQLVLAEKKIIATDLATAFKPSEVRLLDSWLGAREKINADFLHRLDADRLLHNFRVNAGIPSSAKNLDGWEHPTVGLRGHFVGHYLSASASAVANNGDTLLLNRLNYMVDVLAQCQQKWEGSILVHFLKQILIDSKLKQVSFGRHIIHIIKLCKACWTCMFLRIINKLTLWC